MVIGIDASRYVDKQATGVEWYSYHLLNELIPRLGREHDARVKLYSPRDFVLNTEVPFNVQKRIIPLKRLWTLVRMSFEMLVRRPDILFVPSHTLPLILPKRAVITIHDVAFKSLRKCYSWRQFWILNRSTKRAVKRAWRIIVPSEATKRDLVSLFGCRAAKVVVIPHGAPEFPKLLKWSEDEKKALLEQFHLEERDLFAFFVGRLEAKKNLVRLLEGFSRFLRDFPDWKLVLAGKRGLGFKEILGAIEELGLQENVLMPGYITEEEKQFLLSACRIVVLPSLYEGFGLPILEGFAARRPVITSKTSSMPEVAGGAAVFVNPLKAEEIGVALKRLATNGMYVNDLVAKGEARLSNYSWEKAADATYDVLMGE